MNHCRAYSIWGLDNTGFSPNWVAGRMPTFGDDVRNELLLVISRVPSWSPLPPATVACPAIKMFRKNSVSVRAWSLWPRAPVSPRGKPCAAGAKGLTAAAETGRRGTARRGRALRRVPRRAQTRPPRPDPRAGAFGRSRRALRLGRRLRPRGAPSAASLPGAGAAVSPGPAPSRRERPARSPRGGRGVVPAPSSLCAPGPPPSSSAFSSGRTSHCPAAPGGPRADRRAVDPPETLRSSGGRGSLPPFRALLRLVGKPRVCSPRAPRFARFAELLLG